MRGTLALADGGSFEGAGYLRGDPAAVNVAGLRDDALTVKDALVDAVGVKGDVIAEGGVGARGLGIAPGALDAEGKVGVGDVEGWVEGEIESPESSEAFELAEAGRAVGGFEEVDGDIAGGKVEDGRVAGLEDADGAGGLGEENAGVEDADVAVSGLEAGRARVIPDRFSEGAKSFRHVVLSGACEINRCT